MRKKSHYEIAAILGRTEIAVIAKTKTLKK